MSLLSKIGLWIDVTDSTNEGQYKNSKENNNQIGYTNWGIGQPSDGFGRAWGFGGILDNIIPDFIPNIDIMKEDCVHINLNNKWEDSPCDNMLYQFAFVCQKNRQVTPLT